MHCWKLLPLSARPHQHVIFTCCDAPAPSSSLQTAPAAAPACGARERSRHQVPPGPKRCCVCTDEYWPCRPHRLCVASCRYGLRLASRLGLISVQRIMIMHISAAALSFWHPACLCLLRDGSCLCACGMLVWLHIESMQSCRHKPRLQTLTSCHAYRRVSLPFCKCLLCCALQQPQCKDRHLAV